MNSSDTTPNGTPAACQPPKKAKMSQQASGDHQNGPEHKSQHSKAGGHVEEQAVKGFGSGGTQYDAVRPSYTKEVVEMIAERIIACQKEKPESENSIKYDVLELGAGTGKLTEPLINKLDTGISFLATEPSEDFLEILKAKRFNVETALATADNIPLPDNSVRNIVCAQCFHWFADYPNLESIRRVLIRGGQLILVWNVKDFEKDWMVEFWEQRKEVVKKANASLKFYANTGEWRRDIDKCSLFKLHEEFTLEGVELCGDLEMFVANTKSDSSYRLLPEDVLEVYTEKFRALVRNWPGIDVNNITMPMKTLLVVYKAE